MANNEESLWSFRIKDANGVILLNLTKARKRSVKIGLNMMGEASFTYSMEDLFNSATAIGLTIRSLLGLGRNTLECLRNGIVFFSGQIIYLDQFLDANEAKVEVKALGWLSLLETRFVGVNADLVFTNTDAGSIAWSLINSAQQETNGNMGITQGTIQTSINRTITYQRKSIKEALEELSDVENGFDFEITSSKVFNVYYPRKGSDVSGSVVFMYPGSKIKSIQEMNDASELANSIFAIGSGSGIEELNVQRDDLASQAIFGVRKKIVPVKDLNNATVLADIGDEELNKFSQVNPVYKINIVGGVDDNILNGFSTGDTIRIKIDETYWHLDQNFKVFEIHVDISDNDTEDVNLIIGLI